MRTPFALLLSGAALAVGLTLSGCDDTSALAPAVAVESAHPLKLQIGDKVRIVVIGDDKLGGEYQIDGQGQISVPAAGAVRAVGLTAEGLGSALERRLRDKQYLLNPIVNVTISEFRPFYVLGEVEKPGEYPYHTGLNVLSAIAVAGGDTYRANRSTALIQRAGTAKFEEVALSPDVPIYPGDLIKLPERYF
jgi:polysaccharide export outer membrane protein